jgi:hypothetical protein
MSIKEAGTWCKQSINELRKAPLFWLSLAFANVLLIWGQDLAPYAGSVVASILGTLVAARIFSPKWRPRLRTLMALGVLNTPVTALWLILFSMHLNTFWM